MRSLHGNATRLPDSAHASRPWRIHDVAGDFHVEDVWALPIAGTREDFSRLVEIATHFDPQESSDQLVRALFVVRDQLGRWLRWDDPKQGIGSRVPSLRDRLPDDLVGTATTAAVDAAPFSPLYRLDDEFAAEIANRTVHGVLHLGWVPDGAAGYRGQLAVLVKPNGPLGDAYLAAIRPFRHLVVYPRMLREFGDAWQGARPL